MLALLRPSRSLLRFLGRRFAGMILLLFGVTVVAWALTGLVPGDPAAVNLGEERSQDPELVKAFREKYGLDKPLPVQYLVYLGNLLQGDFGTSLTSSRPVLDDLRQYAPATAELAIAACLLGFTVGVTLGVWAALRRNRPADHALRVFSLAGLSVPSFWMALLVLYLFFFRLGIAPGGGRLGIESSPPPNTTGMYTVDALIAGQWSTFWDALYHIMLPALVLAAAVVGYITRYTRSAVLEVASEDYVRAARAKGLPERTVIFRYILRAAAPSMITVLGLAFASILTGAVLVEAIYGFTGIGMYGFRASVGLDLPAIAGVSIFIAAVYLAINFVVDVLYGVIDPRIRIT
ncbi:MAG: ABC transporter permease [Actinobacteria bacterium]|nr:ABC transporter permease [Actinomycetota bacterium]